jgi:hypothetical protein
MCDAGDFQKSDSENGKVFVPKQLPKLLVVALALRFALVERKTAAKGATTATIRVFGFVREDTAHEAVPFHVVSNTLVFSNSPRIFARASPRATFPASVKAKVMNVIVAHHTSLERALGGTLSKLYSSSPPPRVKLSLVKFAEDVARDVIEARFAVLFPKHESNSVTEQAVIDHFLQPCCRRYQTGMCCVSAECLEESTSSESLERLVRLTQERLGCEFGRVVEIRLFDIDHQHLVYCDHFGWPHDSGWRRGYFDETCRTRKSIPEQRPSRAVTLGDFMCFVPNSSQGTA